MQWKSRAAPALFLILLVAGCGPGNPRVVEPPEFQGLTLRVACPDLAIETLVGEYARAWQARQKATLEVRRYERLQGPPDDVDLWLIRPAELARYAAENRLAPLPADLSAREGAGEDLDPVERRRLVVERQAVGAAGGHAPHRPARVPRHEVGIARARRLELADRERAAHVDLVGGEELRQRLDRRGTVDDALGRRHLTHQPGVDRPPAVHAVEDDGVRIAAHDAVGAGAERPAARRIVAGARSSVGPGLRHDAPGAGRQRAARPGHFRYVHPIKELLR